MRRILALLIITSLFVTGCTSARYVSRDQERGVIAIPSISTWPLDHRVHRDSSQPYCRQDVKPTIGTRPN